MGAAVTSREHAADWDRQAGYIRTIAESLLTEYFGDRCPDDDAECLVCKRWRLLEALLANPFGSELEP